MYMYKLFTNPKRRDMKRCRALQQKLGDCHLETVSRASLSMLGGWVNPHREQQTIPQGQTSIPPKSFSTPTANGQIAP